MMGIVILRGKEKSLVGSLRIRDFCNFYCGLSSTSFQLSSLCLGLRCPVGLLSRSETFSNSQDAVYDDGVDSFLDLALKREEKSFRQQSMTNTLGGAPALCFELF